MKKYSVYYKSENLHTFDIIADTEEDAKKQAEIRADNGDEGDTIDDSFSLEYSSIDVVEDEYCKFDVEQEDDQASEMVRFRTCENIKKKFKEYCCKENVSMQMVLEKLLINHLDSKSIL